MHSFGDTILPRVHTASQQAHGKLKIDSVRFYTHKFIHIMQAILRPSCVRLIDYNLPSSHPT